MNPVDVLLRAFDDACSHPWESLAGATRGLGAAEAAWQPPAYVAEEEDPGLGRPGTILWHLNHLEHCHRAYAEILRTRPREEPPDTPPPGALPLERAEPALAAANLALRAAVASLAPGDLEGPCLGSLDVAGFVGMATRHLVWHSAQVRQARRLFSARVLTGQG